MIAPLEGREALFRFFSDNDLAAATLSHAPVHTVAEGETLRAALPGGHSKNLFLRDAKGRLWLISALAETRIDLKRLPGLIGAAKLSFASEALLYAALGVRPGSVTPFALINDRDRRVSLILDDALLRHQVVNFHPLSNDATTSIGRADFLRFLNALKIRPVVVDFAALVIAKPPREDHFKALAESERDNVGSGRRQDQKGDG